MQHSIPRETFGHMSLWRRDDETITVSLSAQEWHCLLVELCGQVLAPVGVRQLNLAVSKIIEQTRAADPA